MSRVRHVNVRRSRRHSHIATILYSVDDLMLNKDHHPDPITNTYAHTYTTQYTVTHFVSLTAFFVFLTNQNLKSYNYKYYV